MRRFVILLLTTLNLLGCGTLTKRGEVELSGPVEWQQWHAKRLESVGGTNGWTTLVGLHWLAEGPNVAGASPSHPIAFPVGRAPKTVGTFTRHGFEVQFDAADDAQVFANGQPVRSLKLNSDEDPNPTVLQVESLKIFLLKRGDRMALRVKDPQSPTRLAFRGIQVYPYHPEWRLEGHYKAFGTEKKLHASDVTGRVQEFVSPGAVYFSYQQREYPLEVALEPGEDRFFIMFRDQTSGHSTYHSGRFLYVDKPDSQGKVIIDFNRSYTPPCGFTSFATCPIPPKQNWLPFQVNAGELAPAGHH